mmetsp:Transcript_23761/g.73724  ORF Transcript_23761/g.73724 Transcript_23761/m.73724 type:complete len:617 (+) Transcript_23761:594-2444(+)
MEGALRGPEGVADLGAVHPPLWVPLEDLARGRLVVGDRVAAELGEEREGKLPPLGSLGLREGVALRREQLERCRFALGSLGCLGLGLPGCELLRGLPLDDLGLGAHVLVDEGEVQVRVLVREVEGPPSDLGAELRHVTLVAVEALGGAMCCGPKEGQVGGAVGRVVAEPGDAPAPGPGLQDVRPGRAVHGDGALPEALETLRRYGAAVGRAEGPCRHAAREVVGRALVVVPQHIHDLVRRDGTLGGWHGPGEGLRGLGEVALVGVELRALGRAQKAEDAPHAPATVEGQGVLQELGHRGVLAAGVRCEAVGAEEVEDAWQVVLGAPPAHLPRKLCDARAVEEVLWVAEVHLPDGEGVGHGHNVAGRHTLCSPDRAGVGLAGHDVEDPEFPRRRVRHHEGLGAIRKVGALRLATVCAVEALLHGHVAHGLHRAARRHATLHGDLREVLDARAVVAVRPVWSRGPAYSPGRAGALADGEAMLVLHAVVHVPVSEGLRYLRDVADGRRLALAAHGRVLGRAGRAHQSRVAVSPVVQRPHAASRPLTTRHADETDVRGVRAAVIRVADDRRPGGAGVPAHGDDGAGERAAGLQQRRKSRAASGKRGHGFRKGSYLLGRKG